MKRKKILFVMESLNIGGAEKSLLTILNLINYDKYEVDLFLFNHTGAFMDMIPKQVNVLQINKNYRIFINNRKLSPFKFLLKADFKNTYYSSMWLINVLIAKLKKEKLYIGWKYIKHLFNDLEKEYDTSIAFLERKTIYFNVDKVKSKNKIGFIHNDYSIYSYDDKLDRKYFKYYNYIATVSDHCKEVLIDIFPEYKGKFIVIKNMISKDMILKLSKEEIENYEFDKDSINIVSVGRLVKQKGFDIAINICKRLVEKNINVKWYIVGEGEEQNTLTNSIKQNNLENNFFLVGSDTNPYKWMSIADIYVQPSRFEGYGITVAEAKALNKPIVASNIPEFEELLGSDRGLLASNEEDFTDKIIELISDSDLKNKLIYKLKNEKESLEELNKFYEVM